LSSGFALCTPAVAAIQQPEQTRDEERARIRERIARLERSITEIQPRASAAQEAYRLTALASGVAGLDTARVGPLRIVSPPESVDRARASFERAWQHYGPLLAGNVPEDLEHRVFVYQDGLLQRPIVVAGQTTRVQTRALMSEAAIDAAVREAVGRGLQATLLAPQMSWIGPGLLTAEPNLEGVYRQLVVGLSPTLRRCLAGELDACWLAMGVTDVVGLQLSDGAASPMLEHLAQWYSEPQRTSLALSHRTFTRLRAECEAGDLRSCDEVLLSSYDQLVPLDREARTSLAAVALEMGGRGSFARLREPAAFPPDYRAIISRTAGADAYEVMATWHERVIAAKPDRPRADREARVGSLLWILLFMAFAARSTRWRLA
jgi:hypothetical protein